MDEVRSNILNIIKDDAEKCVKCKLHEKRNWLVFGEGNIRAKVVFVGEAPGAKEDSTGRLFVGRAGKLLDNMIASIGLTREDVYIINAVKCRPPGNRSPTSEEIVACSNYFHMQLEILGTTVIVALGNSALEALTKNGNGITKRCGKWEYFDGVQILMPCFHPSALLRNPSWKDPAWHAMQKVQKRLEE